MTRTYERATPSRGHHSTVVATDLAAIQVARRGGHERRGDRTHRQRRHLRDSWTRPELGRNTGGATGPAAAAGRDFSYTRPAAAAHLARTRCLPPRMTHRCRWCCRRFSSVLQLRSMYQAKDRVSPREWWGFRAPTPASCEPPVPAAPEPGAPSAGSSPAETYRHTCGGLIRFAWTAVTFSAYPRCNAGPLRCVLIHAGRA